MAEYLAPGVYVEETSFRAKSIEGVSTSTTGFVGPTRKGPLNGPPELITSFDDFERIYGGLDGLELTVGTKTTNFIAHAVRNYFDNGGSRLYVARTYLARDGETGVAESNLVGGAGEDGTQFVARAPGDGGNGRITVTREETAATEISMEREPEGTMLIDDSEFVKRGDDWLDAEGNIKAGALGAAAVFVTVAVLTRDADGNVSYYHALGLAPGHPKFIGDVLNESPSRRTDALQNTFAINIGDNISDIDTPFHLRENLAVVDGDGEPATVTLALTLGNDGQVPATANYRTALEQLSRIDDISIVAAPGYSSFGDVIREGIQDLLITHAETRRAYRIAVLDTPQGQSNAAAIAVRGRIDSSYAALYYPWIVTANPLSRPDNESIPRELTLPSSGFVCGIYARNDIARGVAKSPGNEVVRGALRFETDISFGEQEALNLRGVNCLSLFPGRGYRLWGARTATSDPDWKYVGPRRYFLYLEHSIDRSTQWAVFENNGPRLWSNVRDTVTGFLDNEWKFGSLLGATAEQAYFVRCDRTTMTQNDLDNGRMICLIGFAVRKPAEFVVFRIGQKTADANN